jgi:hypothetical protein
MKYLRPFMAVSIVLAGAASWTAAQAPGEKAGGKETKTQTKSAMQEAAATIDFNKTLGLAFDSLTTLGTRIDQARRAPDPVGLASAARELAVAEQISSKKAALASDTIMKEAVELAKLRFLPTELNAVALMVQDKTVAKELATEAARAKKAQDDVVAGKGVERPKGIRGTVHFDSRTNIDIAVYVNGQYRGTMGPYGDIFTFVGDPHHASTHLYARAVDGRYWHHHVHGNINDYQWILNP